MLKGCERKMVMVQGRDKGTFEVAFFVLRRESEKKPMRQQDLLEEANRIINENRFSSGREGHGGKFTRRAVLLWLFGFLSGSGGALLLMTLLR